MFVCLYREVVCGGRVGEKKKKGGGSDGRLGREVVGERRGREGRGRRRKGRKEMREERRDESPSACPVPVPLLLPPPYPIIQVPSNERHSRCTQREQV